MCFVGLAAFQLFDLLLQLLHGTQVSKTFANILLYLRSRGHTSELTHKKVDDASIRLHHFMQYTTNTLSDSRKLSYRRGFGSPFVYPLFLAKQVPSQRQDSSMDLLQLTYMSGILRNEEE